MVVEPMEKPPTAARRQQQEDSMSIPDTVKGIQSMVEAELKSLTVEDVKDITIIQATAFSTKQKVKLPGKVSSVIDALITETITDIILDKPVKFEFEGAEYWRVSKTLEQIQEDTGASTPTIKTIKTTLSITYLKRYVIPGYDDPSQGEQKKSGIKPPEYAILNLPTDGSKAGPAMVVPRALIMKANTDKLVKDGQAFTITIAKQKVSGKEYTRIILTLDDDTNTDEKVAQRLAARVITKDKRKAAKAKKAAGKIEVIEE